MKRRIGQSTLNVDAVGLGCMGLSEFYGEPTNEQDGVKLIHQAIELGVTHFDTAEIYGPLTNETLLGKALKGKRDKVAVATKFGPVRNWDTGELLGLDGSPKNCRRAVEGSLRRLGTDHIDLYYLHRLDPKVPVEDTVGEMAKLVDEGKVGAIGLSEVLGDTLRQAAKTHPIAAVQSEYSIFTRGIEDTLFPALEELGTSLVAYSPLGRGMLAGAFREQRPTGSDWRSTSNPRFQADNFDANIALADEVKTLATHKGVIPSQVALAWVLAQGDHIVTIPGTTRLENLKANMGAYQVSLTASEMDALGKLASRVKGERYTAAGMASVDV